MSHEATAWARQQTTGSSSAKFVLLLLADYAGTDYSCYPSVAKLATVAEMGESTVRAATKKLAEAGLIRVFYRYRDDHSRRSCRYQLMVDGPDTAEPDADDWAAYRQISAEDPNRQDSAEAPLDLSGPPRQDSALIPYKEPSPVEPPPVTPGAARSNSRATRIPDGFYPTLEMQEWFKNEGLAELIPNPKATHEDFCDYWRAKAGADATKKDWPATWRRWMRTAAARSGGYTSRSNNGPRMQSTTDMKVNQTLTLAEKYRQMEENQ